MKLIIENYEKNRKQIMDDEKVELYKNKII